MSDVDPQPHQIEAQGAVARQTWFGGLWRFVLAVYHNIVFQIAVMLMCAFSLYHGISESHAWMKVTATSHMIAERFDALSVGKIWDTIEKRERTCEYHWLFVCSERQSRFTPLQWTAPHDSGLLESAGGFVRGTMWGQGVMMAARAPDAAFYLLRKNFEQGWLSFTMATLFVTIVLVLNYFLMKINPLLFPVWMLAASLIASVLYSVLAYIIMSFTIVAAVLFIVVAMIAAIPRSLIDSCEGVARAEEAGHLMHQLREVWARVAGVVSSLFRTT